MFPEALLLHYLDDMDSKMECMRALIEKDPQPEGYFTAYSQALERVALRKTRYLDAAPARRVKNRRYWQGDRQRRQIPGTDHFHTTSAARVLSAFRRAVTKPETRARRHSVFRSEASAGAQRRKEIAMARDRELPPPLEMMCLNALWEIGEGNVEDVRRVVSQNRPLAYTTVLTLLDRLTRRGAVSRRKEGTRLPLPADGGAGQAAPHGAAPVPRISLRRLGGKAEDFSGSSRSQKALPWPWPPLPPSSADTPGRPIAYRPRLTTCLTILVKILVRATNWIGDAVMSLPALRAIRARYPGGANHGAREAVGCALYEGERVHRRT